MSEEWRKTQVWTSEKRKKNTKKQHKKVDRYTLKFEYGPGPGSSYFVPWGNEQLRSRLTLLSFFFSSD